MDNYSSTFLTGNKVAIRAFLISEILFFIFLLLFYPPNKLASAEAEITSETLLPSLINSTTDINYFYSEIKERARLWFPVDLIDYDPMHTIIDDIKFVDGHWQAFMDQNETKLNLLAAYYDDRLYKTGINQSLVRILAIVETETLESINIKDLFFKCELWFNESTISINSHIAEVIPLLKETNKTTAVLVMCPVPHDISKVPIAVSMMSNKMNQTKNLLKIFNERPPLSENTDFKIAVFIKYQPYLVDDLAIELVQFIEINRYFGVDKFFFNQIGRYPNIQPILDYYKQIGVVELLDIHPTVGLSNDLYLNQILEEVVGGNLRLKVFNSIVLHHCLYKNLYKYKFILPINMNEVFVPRMGTSYADLLKITNKLSQEKNAAAYFGVKKYFISSRDKYPGIPPSLNFLQNINAVIDQNLSTSTNSRVSFFNAEKVEVLHDNTVIDCLIDCEEVKIPSFIGQVNQYEEYNNNQKGNYSHAGEDKVEQDKLLWKFKDDLIGRIVKVLQEVNDLRLTL